MSSEFIKVAGCAALPHPVSEATTSTEIHVNENLPREQVRVEREERVERIDSCPAGGVGLTRKRGDRDNRSTVPFHDGVTVSQLVHPGNRKKHDLYSQTEKVGRRKGQVTL